MTSFDHERSVDANTLSPISRTQLRRYNLQGNGRSAVMTDETARSAILAIAWLLVCFTSTRLILFPVLNAAVLEKHATKTNLIHQKWYI